MRASTCFPDAPWIASDRAARLRHLLAPGHRRPRRRRRRGRGADLRADDEARRAAGPADRGRARLRRADPARPHRDRRRRRSRPVHRPAGRAGDRADARLRPRHPGARRVLARRARGRGGRHRRRLQRLPGRDRRAAQGGLLGDVRRVRRAARPTRRSTGRATWRPSTRWWGRARSSTRWRSRRGVRPLRPSAAWLARAVAGGLAELLEPEPMYLRRPDAVAPGKPKAVS